MRRVAAGFVGLVAWVFVGAAAPARAQPPAPAPAGTTAPMAGGMPDVARMSGIPLVDGRTPAGTIVVRCLHGGMDAPAIGVEVVLEVSRADGTPAATLRASTAERGRATFAGLEPHAGGQAVARVTLGGRQLVSEAIPIGADAGAAVMLVGERLEAGAAASAPAASRAATPSSAGGSHGGAEVPLPGKPFPLPDRPIGTVIVGALDLARGVPIAGIEVELHVEPAAGATAGAAAPTPEILRLATNGEGRAVFEGLAPPKYAAGTRVTVVATLAPGAEPQRSDTFELPAHGVAVVLTVGSAAAAASAGANAPMPAVPPPHRDASVPPGQVRVELVDPEGAPVAGGSVEVVRQDMSGGGESVSGVTDAGGLVDVEVTRGPDALFFVGATHDGAPFRSGFFQLPEDAGARVVLRVWPVTGDRAGLRSVVQFDLEPRENDKVLVSQIFAVMHEGERAYWPPGGLRIDAPPGALSLQVLPGSSQWIEAREDAGYVELARPIPPGEEVRLSFAYLLDHDGEASITWQAPFPLMKGLASLPTELQLTRGRHGPPQPAPEGQDDLVLYELEAGPAGVPPCGVLERAGHRCPAALAAGGTSLDLAVAGLPRRDPTLRRLAIGLGAGIALATALALLLTPRSDPRRALLVARDRQLARLRAGGLSMTAREALLAELDLAYRGLDALEVAPPPNEAGSARR